MSRKVKTIITERYREQPEVTLEGWLLELQDRPEIVAVRVFKRRGADWKALPRDADILPPFDVDPDRRHHQLIGQEAACGGAPTSLDKLKSVTVDLSF